MGKIIYWKKYDEPKVAKDPIFNFDMELHGEWVCEDERVEWFAILGFTSADPKAPVGIKGEMLLKNGERKSFQEKNIDNKVDERIVAQAEQYLKQLK